MSDSVMSTRALPDFLFRHIPTERVRVRELHGMIQLMPINENMINTDCTVGLRGLFTEFDEMSTDDFLERKHAEKELDR
ncbi:MAG: hypothetical protein LBM69_04940 [Lachnospiraceae bacterium]|jgi:hypothetical protein|nr:hypothetical protein [Lachnospiraceae bacterium]